MRLSLRRAEAQSAFGCNVCRNHRRQRTPASSSLGGGPFAVFPASSYVRLTVSDTGDGITPEFLPYVFHRFRQEEGSISRKAGGLGLGLAVVRHLVELHGGTVSAESAGPGQGLNLHCRSAAGP